jgi:hypothetical protein
MQYLKLTNGQPEIYSIGQLRRDNANTSFPKHPSDALLAEWDVYPYTIQDQPGYDSLTESVSATHLVEVDGAWTQGWAVDNLPVETAENNVRSRRNTLLSQTDWMALSDVTMSPDWAAYRQALRDVTAQPGFPYAVVWPTKPE